MESGLAVLLLVSAVPVVIALSVKLIRDPKVALYLAVFTAPVTRGLGDNAFLHRLSISEVMGTLFIVIWFLKAGMWQNRHRPSNPLDSYVLLLVYTLVLSLVVNLSSYKEVLFGIEEVAVILYLVLLYFSLTWAVTTDQEVQRLLDIWLLAAALVVGIGLWDSLGHRMLGLPQIIGPVKEHDQYRVAATFKTTGQLGVYLLTTFFVSLACYFLPEHSRRKRLGLALLMVGCILLAIFASRRSSYAAFLVGLSAFLLLKVKNPRVLLPGLLVCTVSFIFIMTFLKKDEDLSQYFQHRVSILTLRRAADTDFVQVQLEGIAQAFLNNPLTGVGIGGFFSSKYDRTRNEVHSTYGQLLAETGILGLLAYGLFMFVLLKMTYEEGFILKDSRWSVFCSIIFAAFAGFGVSYMYNRHLRERAFWLLVGIIMCTYRLAKARSKTRQQKYQKSANTERQSVIATIESVRGPE